MSYVRAMEAEQSPAASLTVRKWKPRPLTRRSALADQLLEGLVRLLGQGVLEHLDLVELVAADHAALVGAVGARLAAEARRIGEQLMRQVAFGENLAAVQGGEGRSRPSGA